MPVKREIPESRVASLADQFCDTAKMLYDAIPHSWPQAIRVNAIFAVELYIKSLDCHWERHSRSETLGVDCDLITVKPDKYEHKLHRLFEHLEDWAQQYLIDRFASHQLNKKYPGLRPILAEYSDTFANDRYIFQWKNEQGVPHPVSEPIDLAMFFKSAVSSIERVRLG
jgi:hypothetical protein